MTKKPHIPRLVDEGDDAPSYVIAIMQSVEVMTANMQASLESLRKEIRENRESLEYKIDAVQKEVHNQTCKKEDKFISLDREIRDIKKTADKLEEEYDGHVAETGKSNWKIAGLIFGLLAVVGSSVFSFAYTYYSSEDSRLRVHELEEKHQDVIVPQLSKNVVEHGRFRSDLTEIQSDVKSHRIRIETNTHEIAINKVRIANHHQR